MNTYNAKDIIPPSTRMNATINSLAMQLEDTVNFSIQIVFTGTPTGSFKLQASCDPVPQPSLVIQADGKIVYSPTNWTDVANSTFNVSAAGNVQWDYNNCGFTFVRAVYTDGSSGASTAIITSSRCVAKGV